ncbi:MAG: hypothetical protein C0594_16525 [Marinilabiliales bacterium]|nr:MAG: hypothetical protein C0594_16525 [Marinilabiliales bacterium]
MFRFAHPDYLYLLGLVPLLVLVFVLFQRRKKKNIEKVGDRNLMDYLMPEHSPGRQIIKFIVLMLALVSVVFTLARPQLGSKLEEVKREGVELIIALDVSNSMMAEDIKPNRLERAKQAISKLIDRLHSDKIGLIVFAGQSYMQLPVTIDYAAAKMFLESVNTDIIPVQGTAIGSAIEMAMNSFSPNNDKNRAIIIITDGENHEDDAIKMAEEAKSKGITVHTIGMGLSKGGPIPVQMNYGQRDYRKDKDGKVIISKLNEVMLQQIAAAGGGIYIRANNAQTGLNVLFDEINSMEKQEFDANIFADYDYKYQYPLFFALFFLLVELMILERKNRIFKGFNLFKEEGVKK